MSGQNLPLKIAFLWHMHQPNYEEPGSSRLVLPWVRLHAVKDYLDMPLTASKYDNVRVTFNLVPSLLDQLDVYINGGTDDHLELSRKPADELDNFRKSNILESFFSANPENMIEHHPRYNDLYRKAGNSTGQAIQPQLFSSEEIRDLQVWSNLAWVDPIFRDQEPVKSLFAKGRYFTEEEKHSLLDWQIKFMGEIVAGYRDLLNQKKIDISFTPYYHPILPLLCDTNSALEALPGLTLPRQRFRHPEDAEYQIRKSMDKYMEVFGVPMQGMWPSEGSVSEEVAALCLKLGIKWLATDEEVLFQSLKKSRLSRRENPSHAVYDYGPGLKLLFRDHALSDRIGFVYSGWDADRAVDDFITHLKSIRKSHKDDLERTVVPVILDGENAWEYFPEDGNEFLNLLYKTLGEDPQLETVTMTEAAQSPQPYKLPSLFAGSWINHNFAIWIGHAEDRAAWDLLSSARQALTDFVAANPNYDAEKIQAAWRQIYIAEGSDWCWWYGEEHRGSHNQQFDQIYRRHLIGVYDLLGLDTPVELLNPIYHSGSGQQVTIPDGLISPELDGCVTHFYEWGSTGCFDCRSSGGAMHQVDRYLSKIYFGYDHDRFYIRLDFVDNKIVDLFDGTDLGLTLQLNLLSPRREELILPLLERGKLIEQNGRFACCADECVEIALERSFIWRDRYGPISFAVTLRDGEKTIETRPEFEPISFDVPEQNKEFFWPS